MLNRIREHHEGHRNEEAFSLAEMMVSITIFSIVMVVSILSLIAVNTSTAQTILDSEARTGMVNVKDSIKRDILDAKSVSAGVAATPTCLKLVNDDGSQTYYFLHQKDPAMTPKCGPGVTINTSIIGGEQTMDLIRYTVSPAGAHQARIMYKDYTPYDINGTVFQNRATTMALEPDQYPIYNTTYGDERDFQFAVPVTTAATNAGDSVSVQITLKDYNEGSPNPVTVQEKVFVPRGQTNLLSP